MALCSRGRILLGAFTLMAILSAAAQGSVPRLIHYQGKLRDAGGAAVNDTVSLRFRLYDNPDGTGTPLFDETQPTVTVSNGLFNVMIGSQAGDIPDATLNAAEVYLGVSVNDTTELTPRTRVGTSPYAVRSDAAERLVTPGTTDTAASVDLNGKVGIGTTTPTATLDVAGGLRIGDDSDACDASKAGTFRWNGESLEFCTGDLWQPILLALRAPTLASPSNGATGVATLPTVVWNVASGASSYKVHLDNDSDFSSPVVNGVVVGQTQYTLTSPLGTGATYYWKVESCSLAGGQGACGLFSDTWSFTTLTMPASCLDVFNGGSTSSGVYTIDADGAGATAPFDVYCDMATDGGGWTVLMKGSQIGQVFTSSAVGSPGSGNHKLSDAQINAVISAAANTYNLRFSCGSYIGKANIKSGWASDGSISTCAGVEGPGFCLTESCGGNPYCGVQVSTTNGATTISSMLNPSVYGSGYAPCRVHNTGDYALNYMSR